DAAPLILVANKNGAGYHPEQAKTVPIGIARGLYETVHQYVNGSEYFQIFETFDDVVQAFKREKIEALLTSTYFFNDVNLKELAIPVYRQELSNVSIGLAINETNDTQVLVPIMRKYLVAGGQSVFIKKTKNVMALRQKVQAFLTLEECEVLKQKQIVKVYLQKNHGDFSRYNQNLQCYTGLAIRVLNYLSQVLEIKFVPTQYSGKNGNQRPILDALYSTELDMIFAIFLTQSREREQEFFDDLAISLPFAHTQPVLMTSQNQTKLSLTHVKQIKVGVLEYSYVRNYVLDYQIHPQELCEYQTTQSLVEALQNYEIQAIMVSHDTATELLKKYQLRIDFQLPNHVERILCSRNENQAFMQIINKALVFIDEAGLESF
ncbi:MAG: hypothetical protein ACRCZG_06030, partial [Culicoidibacterales bacterium]